MEKKLISEMDKVKISDVLTTYPNIKFENVVTSDSLPKSLLDDLQLAASRANPPIILSITTAKSDHDRKTASGYDSRHWLGMAVDIAILDGTNSNKGTSPKFKEKGDRLSAELENLGYTRNKEWKNPKAVLWQMKDHYDHLHVSNMTGRSSDETEQPSKTTKDEKPITLPSSDDLKKEAEELYKEIIDFKINGIPLKTILGVTATSLGAIASIDFWEVLKAFGKSFKGIRRIPPEEIE